MTTETLLLKPNDTITFYNDNKILNTITPIASLFNYFDNDIELCINKYSDGSISFITVKIEKSTLLYFCDSYKLNV